MSCLVFRSVIEGALQMPRSQLPLVQQSDEPLKQHGPPLLDDFGPRRAVFQKMLDQKRRLRAARNDQLGPLAQQLIEPQASSLPKRTGSEERFRLRTWRIVRIPNR